MSNNTLNHTHHQLFLEEMYDDIVPDVHDEDDDNNGEDGDNDNNGDNDDHNDHNEDDQYDEDDDNFELYRVKLICTTIKFVLQYKEKNISVDRSMFKPNEIINGNNNETTDLSPYVIQMITDTIIEVTTILRTIFTDNNDINSISSISNIVQEWINKMENNGGYSINIYDIQNVNALLYWIIIMISNVKYINIILNMQSCPADIFTSEYLSRQIYSQGNKLNTLSLLTLSVFNEDIRATIILNIGKDKYTELLHNKIELQDHEGNHCVLTHFEIACYYGSLYNMLIEDSINYNNIQLENDNILHLFFTSINYFSVKNRKKIFDIDQIPLDNIVFTEKMIEEFKKLRYNEPFGINAIFNNTRSEIFHVDIVNILMEYGKIVGKIYDNIEFINNQSDEFIMFVVPVSPEKYLTNINKNLLEECIFKSDELLPIITKDTRIEYLYRKLHDMAVKNNITHNMLYYIDDLTDNILNEIIKDNISCYSILIKQLIYKNINHFIDIYKRFSDESKYHDFIKILLIRINNDIDVNYNYFEDRIDYRVRTNNQLLEIFKNIFDNQHLTQEIYVLLFKQYISGVFLSCNIDIDNIYNVLTDESKNIVIKYLIEKIINKIQDYPETAIYYNDIFGKYIVDICRNITIDTFIPIINAYRDFATELLTSTHIPSIVKFGSQNNYHIDEILIHMSQYKLNYVLPDVEEYKKENKDELIRILLKIDKQIIMHNFIKIFNIDTVFVEENNIKHKYLENILEDKISDNNLKIFILDNTFNQRDLFNIESFKLKKNNCISILFRNIIGKGEATNDFVMDILNNTTIVTDDKITKLNIKKFYNTVILKYKTNNVLIHNIIKKYLDLELTIEDISKNNKIDFNDNSNSNIVDIILNTTINSQITIMNLIKYYSTTNKELCTHLISIYNNTFINSEHMDICTKLEILYNLSNNLTNRIPNILISQLNNKVISDDIINIIIKLSKVSNINISKDLYTNNPVLVHIFNNSLDKEQIEFIDICINDYDILIRIINFTDKSTQVMDYIKNKIRELDINLYTELLVNYNFDDSDKELILKNLTNNAYLLKNTIKNKYIIKSLFDGNYYNICKLVNNSGNYVISMLEPSLMIEYMHYYTYNDMIETNKQNICRFFAFMNSKETIYKLIELYGIEKLDKYNDNFGFNIYYRMIINDMYNDNETNKLIPLTYLLNKQNIFTILKKTKTSIIEQLLSSLDSDTLESVYEMKDSYGNSIMYYITIYHNRLIKKNINTYLKYMCTNYNYETFMMQLVKVSKEYDLEPIIKWIVNNTKITLDDYYYDNKSGSLLSYCLKYNKDLFKLFINTEPYIIKTILGVYDTFNMICPYSDYSKSKTIMMNLIQITSIVDHELLKLLIKTNKYDILKYTKETLKCCDVEHNLLHIAMFNNPESLQVLLGTGFYDNKYLKQTEEEIGGFEKVIDIQPASWYYLQQSLNNKYKLSLDLDSHWYGYNYKRKMTYDNINEVTHYILDKQTLATNDNRCNICDTYTCKVVYIKCHHKVCITCALHTDKCGTCRVTLTEKDKILI